PALSPFEQIRYAREIIRLEGTALLSLASRLDTEFCRATELLFDCESSVIVTGMGKAGLIGQKLAATLASTGTRSHFLHPAEAFHGDLGRIHRDDVVLVLSQSGETEEVLRLLPPLAEMHSAIIAITGRRGSTLAKAATVVLDLGPLKEACSLGLAPSTSTTAMLAMGDALALVTSRMRAFQPEDFARFHPGGSLGRKLSKVEAHMRKLDECRTALVTQTVREVLVSRTTSGRRSGALMLLDDSGKLCGIFTDSDLAKLFERREIDFLETPVEQVMTRQPLIVPAESMVVDALKIMAERRISELPVVNPQGCPIGLLDLTDLVGSDLAEQAGSDLAEQAGSDLAEQAGSERDLAAEGSAANNAGTAPHPPVPRPNILNLMNIRSDSAS
ncbi:MAG: KpsF/GutQ family sugar-phosphate isomerase, partial [Pirellulales bacterium]